MKKKKKKETPRPLRTKLAPFPRVLLAIIIPILGALIFGGLAGNLSNLNEVTNNAPLLAGLGIGAWFTGLFWYGLGGMGLRGRRPLFAGIGFATVGWLIFIIFRFTSIDVNPQQAGSGQVFLYLLLFEAFAVQLWAFGLCFRSIADWRDPLTAAIGSGILFGVAALLLFQEVYAPQNPVSALYFTAWGVFFGLIRLRTGSLLGGALVQALHSFTAWVVLGPMPPLTPISSLQSLYFIASLGYLIMVWRLWPKEVEDYRV
jgi:membrane protease YdiL (CAAX protease family)